MDYYIYPMSNGTLCHHGIKGMKWGIRRYQNKDGSLTPAGKKRAYRMASDLNEKLVKSFKALDEYGKSIKVQTIKNPYKESGISTFTISDIRKRKEYDRLVKETNDFMDYLDKQGFDWQYHTNYGPNGKVDSGKAYVETIVNGINSRSEW